MAVIVASRAAAFFFLGKYKKKEKKKKKKSPVVTFFSHLATTPETDFLLVWPHRREFLNKIVLFHAVSNDPRDTYVGHPAYSLFVRNQRTLKSHLASYSKLGLKES